MAPHQDEEESEQKTLAETVCFDVEDFGEARSLLQSLKHKEGRNSKKSKSHFIKSFNCFFFLAILISLSHEIHKKRDLLHRKRTGGTLASLSEQKEREIKIHPGWLQLLERLPNAHEQALHLE